MPKLLKPIQKPIMLFLINYPLCVISIQRKFTQFPPSFPGCYDSVIRLVNS